MIAEEELRAPAPLNQDPPRATWVWRYAPLIIWAALIFIGSSNILSGSNTSLFLVRPMHWLFPSASDATLQLIHLLIRKAGHLTEYGILAWLAARAFRSSAHELLQRQWFWLSLLLVVVYSLSDEFHQSFVPSRGASLHDSLIDSVGGLIALLWIAIRRRRAGSSGKDSKAQRFAKPV